MSNFFKLSNTVAQTALDFELTENASANSFLIKNLGPGVDQEDAVNLSQVQTLSATKPLSQVLLAGNTSDGININASSSQLSCLKLKTVAIEPLAFPLETSINVLGNLDIAGDIDFSTDVAIRRQNQNVMTTLDSNVVAFSSLPVCNDVPSSANQLVNKAYVDSVDVGVLDSIVAGTGISVDSTNPQNPVVTNTGLLTATAGVGMNVTSGQNPVFTNTGVLDLTVNQGLILSGSKTSYTLSNDGILDVSSSTGLAVNGPKSNKTFSLLPDQVFTSLTGTNVFVPDVLETQISQGRAVPSTQQLIANTFYINDNASDIQAVYNAHSSEQGVVFKISSGSYGGSTLTLTNSCNQMFECASYNGSTITELANRGLSIENCARIRINGLQVEGAFKIGGQFSGPPAVTTNCVFTNCEFLGTIEIGYGLGAVTGFLTFYNCTFSTPFQYNLGTATIYCINCDFQNQPITNNGLPTRLIINNAARMNSVAQANYIGYGQLVRNDGVSFNVQNALATPANVGSIQSSQIEVGADPASANALTRKSYVDAQVATKVGSVIAGTNITITGTPTNPIINASGGGGGGANQNIALLNATASRTELGALALSLSESTYAYQIEDDNFGDARVSINSNGELVIVGGGSSGTRTFSIQLQFRLDTNAPSTSAGPVTFYLVDVEGQEKFFGGEFDPQAFTAAKQIFFYNEVFTLTIPFSASTKTYKLYIKDDVNKWQNGGNITEWTVRNVKASIWYYGQIGFTANVPTAITAPISVAPSITSIASAGPSSITLNWSAVSGDNYYIYRSLDNSTFTLVYVISNIYNTYTDTGLNPQTTYYYKVGAENEEGVGPLSESANATTDVSTAPSFSDYWSDARAPFTGFGGSFIHPASDAIISSAVMTRLGGPGSHAIYMIRRQDTGNWPQGTQHSPVVVKSGFPGGGGVLIGDFTTRSAMAAAGGACTWDADIAGRTWNISQTKSPYNFPYNPSTNPYGYSSWP